MKKFREMIDNKLNEALSQFYIVTDASRKICYIFDAQEKRDNMFKYLKDAYPKLTLYIGASDKLSGAVYFDKPKFPK